MIHEIQMSSDMNAEGIGFPVKNNPATPEVDANTMNGTRTHKRRPHTKSRNGCTTCKRRRVKCDETRPVCRNCQHLRLECRYVSPASLSCADLQITNLKLLHHYDVVVAKTISDAGISTEDVWVNDVVAMGLKYPFLMHAILMFSATHLARSEPKEYCNAVVQHRSEALTLLRNDVQHINSENLDALVAASVLLILDALANAAVPSRMTPSSLPASTWLHHVRGAATILLAVGVLPPTSKFYSFMGVDLLDLASCYSHSDSTADGEKNYSSLQCFMPELADLYPVALDSPYFSSLAFLDKLQSQRSCADFILRVFSFPALMDREFVKLIASNDAYAKRIVGAYYRLVRGYVREMRDKVWFLDGVSTVLPIDMDSQYGGLGFITDALPISQNVDSILAKFDASFSSDPKSFQPLPPQPSSSTGPSPRSSSAAASQSNHASPGQLKPPTTQMQAHSPQMSQSVNTPNQTVPVGHNVLGLKTDTPLSSAFSSANNSTMPSPANGNDSPDASGSGPKVGEGIGSSSGQNSSIGLNSNGNGNNSGYPSPTNVNPQMNQNMFFGEVPGGAYGRIHKQANQPSYDYGPMPGSGGRLPQPQAFSRSRNNSRSIRPMVPRNRNIIRPGMMGLPIDPSIPDNLLGDFDFADIEYPGIDEGAYGVRDIIFDTNSLEWKPQHTVHVDVNGNPMSGVASAQNVANNRNAESQNGSNATTNTTNGQNIGVQVPNGQIPHSLHGVGIHGLQSNQNDQNGQNIHNVHNIQGVPTSQTAQDRQNSSGIQGMQGMQDVHGMGMSSPGQEQSSLMHERYSTGIQDIKQELADPEFSRMIDFDDSVGVGDTYRDFS